MTIVVKKVPKFLRGFVKKIYELRFFHLFSFFTPFSNNEFKLTINKIKYILVFTLLKI